VYNVPLSHEIEASTTSKFAGAGFTR